MAPVIKVFQGHEAIRLLFGDGSDLPARAARLLKFDGQRVQLLELFRLVQRQAEPEKMLFLKYPPQSLTRAEAINMLSAALSSVTEQVSVIDFRGDNRRQALLVAIRPESAREGSDAAHQAC